MHAWPQTHFQLTTAKNEALRTQASQGHPRESREGKTNLFGSHTAVNYSLLVFPAARPGGSNPQSYPCRSHPPVGRHQAPPTAHTASAPRVNPKRNLRVPRQAPQRQETPGHPQRRRANRGSSNPPLPARPPPPPSPPCPFLRCRMK